MPDETARCPWRERIRQVVPAIRRGVVPGIRRGVRPGIHRGIVPGILLVLVSLRVALLPQAELLFFFDSAEYVDQAGRSVLENLTGRADGVPLSRPFTYPLILKLIGFTAETTPPPAMRLKTLQTSLSILTMILFSLALCATVRGRARQVLALVVAFGASLSEFVYPWERAILPEILEANGLLVLLSALLFYAARPTWPRLAMTALCCLLWMNLKDVILLFVPGLLLTVLMLLREAHWEAEHGPRGFGRRSLRDEGILAKRTLAAIVAVGLALVAWQIHAMEKRSPIRERNLANFVSNRMLDSPIARRAFVRHAHPSSDVQATRGLPHGVAWAGHPERLEWLRDYRSHTHVRFLLGHPRVCARLLLDVACRNLGMVGSNEPGTGYRW